MPGFNLSINTATPAVYLTTLTDAEIQQLRDRLDNFNFEVDRAVQYAEIEEIMNRLNGTLDTESDQMDLASLFSVMEKVKEGKPRVSKPYEFVNVLLKIVGHVKKQMGGLNRFPPRGYSGSKRALIQPVQQPSLHGVMSPAEVAERQQVFRRNLVAKTRKIKATNKANSNENYGEVYPVTNAFKIPVGNINNSRTTRASSAANTYNLFNRPRHKAAWNAVFSNTKTNTKKVKKGGYNQPFPKSNTPKFRAGLIKGIKNSTLRNNVKSELYKRYGEAANAKLATYNEIHALLTLSSMKRPGRFYNINELVSTTQKTRRNRK